MGKKNSPWGFKGNKPSPQKNYPTDVAKGDIESGINLLKKDLVKGNIEKDLEYMKREIGGGYAIEEFIERGFW